MFVIIILQFYDYHEWFYDIHKVRDVVFPYLYATMLDSKSIRIRNISVFQQVSSLFNMINYLRGLTGWSFHSHFNPYLDSSVEQRIENLDGM